MAQKKFTLDELKTKKESDLSYVCVRVLLLLAVGHLMEFIYRGQMARLNNEITIFMLMINYFTTFRC
jgi:hypothetical protein